MSDLFERVRAAYHDAETLPEVVAGRCVHTILERASCKACVDVCPRQAWVLDEEQLGIDVDRCDGCGLCAAACPQDAIQARLPLERKKVPDGRLAMFACEESTVEQGPGCIPCLHGVGLNMLLRLCSQEVASIVICHGNCNDCPRGNAPRLDTRIARLNVLLADRGLPGLVYRDVGSREWSQMRRSIPSAAVDSASNRRDFLTGMLQTVMPGNSGFDPGQAQETAPPETAGRLLPTGSGGQMAVFCPQIDPGLCNACNACMKLCPHHALAFSIEDTTYVIEPDRCSGCGICKDLCDQDAISIRSWSIAEMTKIPLSLQRCKDCGIPYFMPTANSAADKLCSICARHRHQRRLFQVLD